MIAKAKTNTEIVREAYRALAMEVPTFRSGEVVGRTGLESLIVTKVRQDLLRRGKIDPAIWLPTVGSRPRAGAASRSPQIRRLFEAYEALASGGSRFDSRTIVERTGMEFVFVQRMRYRLLKRGKIDPRRWVSTKVENSASVALKADCERVLDHLDDACRQREVQVHAYLRGVLGLSATSLSRIRKHMLATDQILPSDWPTGRDLRLRPEPEPKPSEPEEVGYRPTPDEIAAACAEIRAEHEASGRRSKSMAATWMPKLARIYHDGRNRGLRGMAD